MKHLFTPSPWTYYTDNEESWVSDGPRYWRWRLVDGLRTWELRSSSQRTVWYLGEYGTPNDALAAYVRGEYPFLWRYLTNHRKLPVTEHVRQAHRRAANLARAAHRDIRRAAARQFP